MRIALITPAGEKSRSGNRTSADRWAGLLRSFGHQVTVSVDYDNSAVDLMIALHAWRSASAINQYRKFAPHGPLIVALGGTDVNTFLHTESATTLGAMRQADALVGLHDLIGASLPADLQPKLQVIRQSALPLGAPREPPDTEFCVSVIAHLREEKDPLRAALAARLVPRRSKLRVVQLGGAHSPAWAERAREEMAINSRYEWRGEVCAADVRAELARSHLMVISSIQEGGANVISEALVAGVPILASNIAGNVGLLGRNYSGYYPALDEHALAALLFRAESDGQFLADLAGQCEQLRPEFLPEHEQASWLALIGRVCAAKGK